MLWEETVTQHAHGCKEKCCYRFLGQRWLRMPVVCIGQPILPQVSARNDSHGNSTVQLYLVTQLQQYFRRLGQSQIIIFFFLKCNILRMEQFTTYSFHKCLTELIQY